MRPLHEQSQYLKLCNAAILHGCFARPSMGFFMRHAEASERLKGNLNAYNHMDNRRDTAKIPFTLERVSTLSFLTLSMLSFA